MSGWRYRRNSTIESKKEAASRAWGFIEDEDDEIVASFGSDPTLDSADIVKCSELCGHYIKTSRDRYDTERWQRLFELCLTNPNLRPEDLDEVSGNHPRWWGGLYGAYLSLLGQWTFMHTVTSEPRFVRRRVVSYVLVAAAWFLGGQKNISLPGGPSIPPDERIAMYCGEVAAIEDRMEEVGVSPGWSWIVPDPFLVEICRMRLGDEKFKKLYRVGYDQRMGLSKGSWR